MEKRLWLDYGFRADFNGDGIVDAADYTVWRDFLGSTVGIIRGADGHGSGIVDQARVAHFGQMLPLSGTGNVTGRSVHDSAMATSRKALPHIALAYQVSDGSGKRDEPEQGFPSGRTPRTSLLAQILISLTHK